MKKRFDKKDIILFFIILGLSVIMGNAFLQTHFSSDTYVLMDLGYLKYPSEYFLLDGRLISTLICYIAGIINIPFNIYLIGMDFIGIVLLSITIFVLYKKILQIMRNRR